MKKFLVVLSVLFGVAMAANMAGAIEVSVESLTWIDYGFKLNDAFAITSGGQFSLGREYLTFKANYDNVVKARVTLDLVNSVSGGLDKFVKYAYVDFKVADALVVTGGLQKVFFGYLPDWEYPLPVKEYAENNKLLSSADLGIAFSGVLLNKMLTYHVQLLNGEGYATWNSINDSCYQAIVDLRFAYMKDSYAGLSYMFYDNGENTTAKLNHAFAVYDNSKFGPLTIMAQYTGAMTNGGELKSYIEAFVAFKVSDAFSPMAIFNMTFGGDPTIGLGASIAPIKKVAIKPYIAVTLGDTLSYEFKTQMEFKFDLKAGTPDVAAPTAAPAPAVESTIAPAQG